MIDRGADFAWASQYKFEREIRFPPLSPLQVLRTRVDGEALIVEMKLNIIRSGLTIDEVLARRRKVVADMCQIVEEEVSRAFEEKQQQASAKVLHAIKDFTARLLKK
jgi:hypothetical protein